MTGSDVIVVGARCAGSPLAAQLARSGLAVALVDKDRFPSDTASTHFFQAEGLSSLARLGVLERLLAAGAPLIQRAQARLGDLVVETEWPTRDGDVGGALCVRRPVLDTILVEAAEEAGVEVHTGTRVKALINEGGRVGGVQVTDGTGREFDLRAPLVVGADGRGSFVARRAGARMYNVTANERFGYWGYYDSAAIPVPAMASQHVFGEEFLVGVPTDAGLFMVAVLPPLSDLSTFRADPDRSFDEHVAKDDILSDIVRGGQRVGALHNMVRFTGYFREATGPGWVLLGDAGHFKDPAPAQGISDALRQGDRLAAVIVEGLGRSAAALDHDLQTWWRWRDNDAVEQYWFAQDLGRAGPPPAVLQEMIRSLDSQGRLGEFIDILNHRTRPSELLKPGPMLAAASRLFRGGQVPRGQVAREVRDIMGREMGRRRLNRRPVYRSTPTVDGETDAAA